MSARDFHTISIRRLSSGWWHVRGRGPCNWSQPPVLTPEAVREYAFPQAGDAFLAAAVAAVRVHTRSTIAAAPPSSAESRGTR